MKTRTRFSVPTCKANPGHNFEVDGKQYEVIRRLEPNTFDDRGNPTFHEVDYKEVTTMTNKDRADSILINMSKGELVTRVSEFHPNVSLLELRGYTKRDLRGFIVRNVPFEVLLREAS